MIKHYQTTSKLIFIILISALATSAYAQNWWNPHWQYRRTVIYKPQQQPYPQRTHSLLERINQPDACTVTFLTAGAIKKDGSDIRVIGQDGKPRKIFILSIGPGDIVRLAFQAKGTKKHRYYIYYGNPNPKTHSKSQKSDNSNNDNWRPESGLLLQTYKYTGGSIGSALATKTTVIHSSENNKNLIGRAYIPAIFIPGNIFSSYPKTCNLYSGTLLCRKEGTYHFAISSYDSSALYIDDKLVIAWPGKHRWIADIRHNREIKLTAGPHKFELYHVNLTGKGGIVVAWKVPGAASFRIINEKNFKPIIRGFLGKLEHRKKDITADFVYRQENYANMQSTTLFEYKFIALPIEPKTRQRKTQYIWDFGDGQLALGPEAKHVFLHQGIYPVTFQKKLGNKSDTIINRIYIGPNRANWRLRPTKLKNFLPIISTYDFKKLSLDDIPIIIDFFRITGQNRQAIHAARKALLAQHFDKIEQDKLIKIANELTELIIDETNNYADAEKFLQTLSNRLDTSTQAYIAITAQACSILINQMGKDDLAQTLLKSCPIPTEQPKNKTEKLLAITWGDLYRLKGDRNQAKKFYTLAQSATFNTTSKRKRRKFDINNPIFSFAKTGSYAAACEYYLRRREYSAVRKILDRWQWQFPTDKLGGYSCYLRYRLYYAQRMNKQAQLIAKIMKKIAPFSLYTQLITKSTN